jgi:hypothetical protein
VTAARHERTRGDHTPPEKGAGTAFGENGKELTLKSRLIFNPCENSEQTEVFILQSIRNSDAPNSKHSTPFCLGFHGSA